MWKHHDAAPAMVYYSDWTPGWYISFPPLQSILDHNASLFRCEHWQIKFWKLIYLLLVICFKIRPSHNHFWSINTLASKMNSEARFWWGCLKGEKSQTKRGVFALIHSQYALKRELHTNLVLPNTFCKEYTFTPLVLLVYPKSSQA